MELVMKMKTVYDVQQLLKKFGTFVYTGDRIGDLELMEMDIDELYQMEFIQTEVFQLAKLILRKEKRQLQETKRRLYTWQITLSE
ncbi:uncharacterized protein YqgQ [Virgibacillus halotolerans]|nr:uncharacterized protein YqgQ [Virgibacillus halotolerans]